MTTKQSMRPTKPVSRGSSADSAQQHPKPPFPAQHQTSPGLESKLKPRPQYRAATYRAADKLRGKAALITGGDSGIGRAVAVLYAREGANVAIVYLPQEESDAQETKQAVEREGRRALLLPGDVGNAARNSQDDRSRSGACPSGHPHPAGRAHAHENSRRRRRRV